MNTETVVIFGVFDGIHAGHREFISQARELGEQLVAIVARDTVVARLKGKAPLYSEADRINALLKIPEIDLVLLGDEEEGTYKTLKEVNPGLVYLGYDQTALSDNIKEAVDTGSLPSIELMFGKPYEPDTLHSSIINNSDEPRD